MKNNENGRSMVEMLGVLAIIGVLSAGGLAGYSKAMFKHKLNTTMDQITMLVTNIRTMYGTQGNYVGLDKGAAYDLGIIPAAMVEVTEADKDKNTPRAVTLTSPFKGNVDLVTFQADGSTDDTGFKLTYEDLPSEACIALATADFGSGAGSGFIGVKAGSTATAEVIGGSNTTDNASYSEGSALVMSDAIDACNAADNDVTWYFY